MRPLDQDDLTAIEQALVSLQHTSSAPQMYLSDIRAAMEHIRMQDGCGLAYIIGPYFLLVDVGRPWYLGKRVLFEDLVLKVYPTIEGDINDVVKAMYTLRDRFACSAIIAGDTQAGKMIPVYTSHGFKPMGQQLIKE